MKVILSGLKLKAGLHKKGYKLMHSHLLARLGLNDLEFHFH